MEAVEGVGDGVGVGDEVGAVGAVGVERQSRARPRSWTRRWTSIF